MGHRQYTDCVQPINFVKPTVEGYIYLTGILGAIVAAFAASYSVYTLPILIGLLILLITFLIWWLYGRLICLGGVKCVVGAVRSMSDPEPESKGGDDDATINVYLAPGPTDLAKDKQEFWNALQGDFVKEQQSVLQVGEGYVQSGKNLKYMKSLHCEFEGSGIRNLLIWANVVLALLVAALIILLTVPPPLGPALSQFLWIMAFLFALFAGLAGFNVGGPFVPMNPGDPADATPNAGELKERALVVVKGDWIYDSLHQGWNEIHAIHHCQVIPGELNADGTWPADIGGGLGFADDMKTQATIDFWCLEIARAQDAEDTGTRDDPKHNWVVHPLIDGCAKPIIL